MDHGVLDSTSVKIEACHLTEAPVAGLTNAHKVSCQEEKVQLKNEVTKPEPDTRIAEVDEWELADECVRFT